MSTSRFLLGFFVIMIGLSVLFDFPFVKIFFAVFLIYIGYRMLVKSDHGFHFNKQTESQENDLKRVLIFSSIQKKFVSSNFERAEVVLVFSGGDIDLSEVKTKEKEVSLEFVAVFGGLKVKIPKNWSVKSEGVGFAGDFVNHTVAKSDGEVVANVKGVAIFGGVEIIN